MYIRSHYSYNNGIIYIEEDGFFIDNTYIHIRTFFVIKLRLFYVDVMLIIGWSKLRRNIRMDFYN